MSFYPCSRGVRDLWDEFSKYICQPYVNNSEALKSVGFWFNSLFERVQTKQAIDLSFVRVENEVSGYRFNAFCLNNQMYFSQDDGVLTLPQPGTRKHRTDRDIGVWLRDFGTPDAAFKRCVAQGVAEVSSKMSKPLEREEPEVSEYDLGDPYYQYFKSPYTDRVIKGLTYIDDQLFAGRDPHFAKTNKLNPQMQRLTIATQLPANKKFHRDTFDVSDYPWMTEREAQLPHWNRILIHPQVKGTLFGIGHRERVKVDCPPNAVSSHLGCKQPETSSRLKAWGASHAAQGDANGRSVIMIETFDAPFPSAVGPWLSRPLESAKFGSAARCGRDLA